MLDLQYVVWADGTENWETRRRGHIADLLIEAVSHFTARRLKAFDPTFFERTVVVNPTVRNHFRPRRVVDCEHRLSIAGSRVMQTIRRLIIERFDGRWTTTQIYLEHLRKTCLEGFAFTTFERRVPLVVHSLATHLHPNEAADRP